MNLMEILHDDLLEFQAKIDERNRERALEAGGMSVDEVTGSPALRRGINQALRVVEEIARDRRQAPGAYLRRGDARRGFLATRAGEARAAIEALDAALASLKGQYADVCTPS